MKANSNPFFAYLYFLVCYSEQMERENCLNMFTNARTFNILTDEISLECVATITVLFAAQSFKLTITKFALRYFFNSYAFSAFLITCIMFLS